LVRWLICDLGVCSSQGFRFVPFYVNFDGQVHTEIFFDFKWGPQVGGEIGLIRLVDFWIG